MKALICSNYGASEVMLREVEKPSPGEKQILVRVHYSSVQTGDWRIKSMEMPTGMKFLSRMIFGFNRPRQPILGTELSGVVESVGESVTRFAPGMEVMAMTGIKFGAHAEYVLLSEMGMIIQKPKSIGFREGACLSFGGTTALSFLCDKGMLRPGDKVLINGASGAVGIAAVQIARHFKGDVTAICSKANFELVKLMGANKAIDYNSEDFRKNGEVYDIILDTVGNLNFSNSKSSLSEDGRLLLVAAGLPEIVRSVLSMRSKGKKTICGIVDENIEILNRVVNLAELGRLKAVIDTEFGLEQANDAYAFVEKGHKKGNVILRVSG